jgi:hypothetical protein
MRISLNARRKVEDYLSRIDKTKLENCKQYWRKLQPTTHIDYLRRWEFAYCSIRTHWKANITAFLAIKEVPISCPVVDLEKALIAAHVGLYGRCKGIHQCRQQFIKAPEDMYPVKRSSMCHFRDALANELYGIGLAKTAFALEMAFPEACDVVCLDTHMLSLYGIQHYKLTKNSYHDIEDHWIEMCQRFGLPSAIARHVYWNDLHGQKDTRYWSYVLEKEKDVKIESLS